eukprot:CAMPEP_0201542652 /NCGR_PEP_ID=MMETSP0161_2-20130828/72152_1 /ASSEMBLY_ACC=CAM_ASM_000251 /TAXON_ID=180227 /ORGANISM="Neoparamoeba aestuarina, Strain SoJaBio B1-5/56/2" /LENGTH=301 /DNA_ID=CAMNT_0047950325 /DNA_START=70 /DNA_END=975 /DNA_ORIENTATION=+
MALGDLKADWEKIVSKPHKDQAVWFLNAFWNGGVKEHAEKIWEFQLKFVELSKLGDNSVCDLDELFGHKFLETMGETMTVLQLRAKLAEIDLDKNKRMAISEYLLFKYSKSAKDFVNAPQGDSDELDKAQKLVDESSKALDEVLAKLEEQKKAEEEAAKAEAAAKAALEELHAQEKAQADKIAELEKKSETGGVVSRNKAKAELEQVRAEDPLPLRRAKLNQAATLKKSEKARKAAEEAAAKLEVASQEAEKKNKEALAYLERVKASGSGAGQVWWMQREMYEKQQYLPKSKQTMSYPNPE